MISPYLFGMLAALLLAAGLHHAKRNRQSDPWRRHAVPMVLAMLSLWSAACSWAKLVPVIADDGRRQLIALERAPQEFQAVFYATKTGFGLGVCRKVAQAAIVIGAYGAEDEASLEYLRDLSPDSVRHNGFQSFGLWRLRWDLLSEPVSWFYVDVWHDCHWALPLFHSRLGPYPVPALPIE